MYLNMYVFKYIYIMSNIYFNEKLYFVPKMNDKTNRKNNK